MSAVGAAIRRGETPENAGLVIVLVLSMAHCIVCKKWLTGVVRMNCACGFSWCPTHTWIEVEPVLDRLHGEE
jgi:hypothetical protein